VPLSLSLRAPLRRGLALGVSAGLLLAGVATSASPALAAVPSPAGWTTVFSDDFAGPSGTGLDTSRWTYATGHGYPGGAWNWGTGEVETMTSSTQNVYQDGAGHLVIRALRDAAGNWTSGRVETQRTDFQPPAGGVLRVEASIQTPNVSGAAAQGYWPAFWMLGDAARGTGAAGWPGIGEIDVLEDVNGSGSVYGTLHCGTNPGGPCNETTGLGSGQHLVPGAKTGFHTYGVEWDRSVSPQQLRWYVDGQQYFTVRSDQVDATTWRNATGHGFFLILNLAIGGGWPGAPTAATVSGGSMVVDHVAVYSRGGTSAPTPTPTPTPSGTVQAESYTAQSGTQVEATSDTGGGSDVGWIGNGDWLRYDGVDLGTGRSRVDLRVASGAPSGVSGLVQLRLDSPTGPVAASVAVGSTGGWQSWRTVPGQLSASGRHTVYLTFSSGQPADFVNLNWFALA
jgi:beta-glucanase (GH16 family)